MPRNWKKCLHIFIKNKQFKKRQCVTLEEILNTGQAKHRGLEVARYVFLNGMPSSLIVVKSILMNFEHI